MDDNFYGAFFTGEFLICGRKLTLFSAYHRMILEAVGSPFLGGKDKIEPSDLLAAVAACRNRFGSPVVMRPRLRDMIWKWRMNRNKKLFDRECYKFANFVAEHSRSPRFWDVVAGGQKTRDLTGPDVLILVASLIMKTNESEESVWNMSFGRAQWLNAEINELEGSERRFLFDGDLVDPEE